MKIIKLEFTKANPTHEFTIEHNPINCLGKIAFKINSKYYSAKIRFTIESNAINNINIQPIEKIFSQDLIKSMFDTASINNNTVTLRLSKNINFLVLYVKIDVSTYDDSSSEYEYKIVEESSYHSSAKSKSKSESKSSNSVSSVDSFSSSSNSDSESSSSSSSSSKDVTPIIKSKVPDDMLKLVAWSTMLSHVIHKMQ